MEPRYTEARNAEPRNRETVGTLLNAVGRFFRRALHALAILLVAAACTDSGTTASGDAPATGTETETTTETAVAETATETTASGTETTVADRNESENPVDPDAPAASQLDWFVATLDNGGPSVDEIAKRFAPEFLAQVPAAQIEAVSESLFSELTPPFVVESFEAGDAANTAGKGTIASADGQRFDVDIAVSPTEPYQIIGLLIVPAALPTVTIEEADEALAELGSVSAAAVYDVSGGSCDAVGEIRAEQAVPVGSAFKLWILAELAHQVEAGEVSWDDEIEIVDSLKSSPDGEFFSREAGTTASLVDLATAMIEISDNTATDHLLAHLGRANVEAAMGRAGVADPAANVPILSTGNLFALKFVAAAPNASDYRALDQAGKRELLEQLDAATLAWVDDPTNLDLVNADGVAITDPRDLDLEWFATPSDLCRTLVHLADLAHRPGLKPVADILEANPGQGIPFDRSRFPTIRFKGGSEPGVLAGAWWFEDNDGKRFVVAGGVSDPDNALSELDAALALASLITVVG